MTHFGNGMTQGRLKGLEPETNISVRCSQVPCAQLKLGGGLRP
jgi:hypothetical protein